MTHHERHCRRAALLALLLCLPAMLTAADAPAPSVGEDEILDEVIVEGSTLWQLRQAILAAEERFHALYNELNEHDEFDVGCRTEAPLGTRIKKRICHIAFMEDAQGEYARALFAGYHAPQPDQVWVARSGDYRRNALQLLEAHPDLRQLAAALERAKTRYEEERKKRFKGRWVLF